MDRHRSIRSTRRQNLSTPTHGKSYPTTYPQPFPLSHLPLWRRRQRDTDAQRMGREISTGGKCIGSSRRSRPRTHSYEPPTRHDKHGQCQHALGFARQHPSGEHLGSHASINAVQLDLPCRPCSIYGNKPCMRGDFACMKNISPEIVVEKVDGVLNKK